MENNKRPTQVERVLAHLRKHGSITSLEGLFDCRVLSLPKRICELKHQGFHITSKWEQGTTSYGEKYRVKRYFLHEEPKAEGE